MSRVHMHMLMCMYMHMDMHMCMRMRMSMCLLDLVKTIWGGCCSLTHDQRRF